MKKLLATLLAGAMVLCMAPAFAVSAAEDTAPEITVDGKLDDWAGTDTIQITGSGDFEGKKAVWYAVLADDGLYLACDAYHNVYKTDKGQWWENTNFEVHVGNTPQTQYWVSAKGADGTKAYGEKSDNVTDAIMVTETLTDAATQFHTVSEMFIANDKLPANSVMADGSIRAGLAWKTIDDDCNNGGTNAVDNWWAAPGTYPNGSNKAVVTASGVYSVAGYNEAYGYGMNVTYYKAPWFVDNGRYAYVGYDNMKQFDDTIEAMLNSPCYPLLSTEAATSVNAGTTDWYIYKWTGTMTAKEAGEYTLIARKLDNGFVMKVDGDKVFEYWGASHWFDGGNDRLKSDEGSFTLAANETVDVEIYFLELDGGDALEVFATTTPDDTNSGKNINEAFTFDLTKEHYSIDRNKWSNDTAIRGTGHNGSQCEEENFNFDETIDKFLDSYVKSNSKVVLRYADALINDDSYLVEYTGYIVPSVSGTYTFGAFDVDNCFMLEIGGKRAYEFWSGYSWNDNSWGNEEEKQTYTHGNTYTASVELEAGKAYPFTAYFLETDGGQVINLNCSVNGGEKMYAENTICFYTECPHTWGEPVVVDATCTKDGSSTKTCTCCGEEDVTIIKKTAHNYVEGVCSDCGAVAGGNVPDGGAGDATTVVVMLAVIALAGAAIVSKKRRIAE